MILRSMQSPPSSPDAAFAAKSGAARSEVRVQRRALVPYPRERMYALVADVERYPNWFDWCTGARVLARERARVQAELSVRMAGIAMSFSTDNLESPPERIDIALLSGPFRRLSGHWAFQSIGESGSRVVLDLGFEVGSGLLAGALAIGFRQVADRMVDDFCRVARIESGRG
ncbi:MAG: type II toxin-antitoxin system RatA family toxin [Xanthomonadales bacterium]|nr:type II toxin-antitoxin system RatA family toxin [Xanthomonadales bacterium]